jgi:hypothetical protein
MIRQAIVTLSMASVIGLAVSSPAHAQVSKETAAAVRDAFVADLGQLESKFTQLAEAFPQDKYTWRPMEGVRSVSEVLMLAAMEGYAFIPNSFGAKPADLGSREEMGKLRMLSDKAQVIDHLKKGFAHAKSELAAIDPATLTAKRKVMGQDMDVTTIAMRIGGDLHEHLGQMIAYARTNHIVPPWSK